VTLTLPLEADMDTWDILLSAVLAVFAMSAAWAGASSTNRSWSRRGTTSRLRCLFGRIPISLRTGDRAQLRESLTRVNHQLKANGKVGE